MVASRSRARLGACRALRPGAAPGKTAIKVSPGRSARRSRGRARGPTLVRGPGRGVIHGVHPLPKVRWLHTRVGSLPTKLCVGPLASGSLLWYAVIGVGSGEGLALLR